MNGDKVRLNEIVSPKEMKDRRRGPIHLLNNSLRRNTILTLGSFKHHLPYECKLPEVHLPRKDVSQMLKYLLKKQEMNAPDRNLIRRILVKAFDEDIFCDQPHFVNHIEVLEGHQGQTIAPTSDLFYMILKGQVLVQSEDIEYQREDGQTFGELEIMSGVSIQKIAFPKSSLLITMEQNHFATFFGGRFEQIYADRGAELSCLDSLLSSIPTFFKYLFLSTYQSCTYQLGDKIVQKGDPFEHLFIVGDRMKEERLRCLLKGTIGLYELQAQKNLYEETVFAPLADMKVPFFSRQDFQRYVLAMYGTISLLRNSSIFQKSLMGKSSVSIEENPQLSKMGVFMKVKRVKLPSKRSRTEAVSTIENDFRFLKESSLTAVRVVRRREESGDGGEGRRKNLSFCFRKASKLSPFK